MAMNGNPGTWRIAAIDKLRGLAVALMLVDHVRESFFLHRQVADPMDVYATEPMLFFTRLVSHLCAPLFIFLTGLGAWLYGLKHAHPQQAASLYLLKRGLFLILLELTVVNFAWTFSFSPQMLYLQVIWAIGLSMVALSALLWLPWRALLAFALVVIVGHNLLNGIEFVPGDAGYIPWAVLHDRSVIELWGGLKARTSYPVLPWIGVIALGYAAGQLYREDRTPASRQRVLGVVGMGSLLSFLVLRSLNGYGDTASWQAGSDMLHTLMSFLNVTKYPPSLLFLLLTLGLGLLLLRRLERSDDKVLASLGVFGSVPLFFYILHLYLLHVLQLGAFALWGGSDGLRFSFDHVWQIWGMAALLLPILYLPCRLFSAYKRRTRSVWASYL